ncbi:hypothetical protein [Variovorax sp. PCZ-1]|uniref:hypothetical protein n=1 Tax=Variovorax sp. PCZ-1 TaxID=2835533 RepID=UPI001BD16E02|nr:hypothetical protein [Variovorax sp. PCZ-1]MBS7807158.1 hypothetical protein [Variovorax sp. PCZ-1]
MKAWMTAVVATAALAAGAAQANDVSWTITVGSPRPAPRVIYAPPPVVYSPAPVVYQPAPVVVQRVYQPVYQPVYQAAPVVYHMPHGHWKHGHKHGWKHAYKHGYHQGYRHGRHDD